jgi:ribosome-binding protein aMBF1 (putative translation factor)
MLLSKATKSHNSEVGSARHQGTKHSVTKHGTVITSCPRCGRDSEVTRGAELIACWSCAMKMADAVERELQRKSSAYDWAATISLILKKYRLRMKHLSFVLGIPPTTLSHVRADRRPMPNSAMKIVAEKYSECLKTKTPQHQ